MRAKWDGYATAKKEIKDEIKRREESGESLIVRRYEAEDIMKMSSGVFEREVRLSSLFRAYCKPIYSGRASSYRLRDLLKHLERLTNKEEVAELNYYQVCKPEEFNDRYTVPGFAADNEEGYANKFEYVFAEGTNTPYAGGPN